MMWLPNIEELSRSDVETIMKIRWKIEVYHRKLKQTCGLKHSQSHNE